MTAIQFFNAFRTYGADVLVLALGVTLVCSLLKKTVLKKAPSRLYVFLPFAVGFVFYASYRALATMSAAPFTEEFAATCEGGFACGCAATLYYVVYEQFFRAKKVNPVSPLLEGFVPDETREEAAKKLLDGSKEVAQEALREFVHATLLEYAPDAEDADRDALCTLLVKYLSTLCGK